MHRVRDLPMLADFESGQDQEVGAPHHRRLTTIRSVKLTRLAVQLIGRNVDDDTVQLEPRMIGEAVLCTRRQKALRLRSVRNDVAISRPNPPCGITDHQLYFKSQPSQELGSEFSVHIAIGADITAGCSREFSYHFGYPFNCCPELCGELGCCTLLSLLFTHLKALIDERRNCRHALGARRSEARHGRAIASSFARPRAKPGAQDRRGTFDPVGNSRAVFFVEGGCALPGATTPLRAESDSEVANHSALSSDCRCSRSSSSRCCAARRGTFSR